MQCIQEKKQKYYINEIKNKYFLFVPRNGGFLRIVCSTNIDRYDHFSIGARPTNV